MEDETYTGPSNKIGARPKEPDEEKRDYDDYFVGAAAAEPSAATAFISPPPTLSVGPRHAQLPSLDRSELSAFGRRFLDAPLQKGMSDADSVRKEIKFLEEKIRRLTRDGPSPSVEREKSIKSSSTRRLSHTHPKIRVEAAVSEPQTPENVPQVAGANLATSPVSPETPPRSENSHTHSFGSHSLRERPTSKKVITNNKAGLIRR